LFRGKIVRATGHLPGLWIRLVVFRGVKIGLHASAAQFRRYGHMPEAGAFATGPTFFAYDCV